MTNAFSENPSGLKLVEKEKLHVTLKFVGKVSKDSGVKIIETAKSINFKPFIISLESIGFFPSANYIRVVWVGAISNDLENLGKKLNEELTKNNLCKYEEFSAHLTIARVKVKNDSLKELAGMYKDYKFGSFKITGFVLKKSKLSFDGSKYLDLEFFSSES